MNNYIFGHTEEKNAYSVNNYPYGFRLRTTIRYWIETNKNGDRMCSQTLNPKTNLWNKPKKSTYSAVIVMFINDIGHVKRHSFSLGYDNEEVINRFLQLIGGVDKLNDLQKEKVKKGIAISRTQKYIKYEITNVTGQTEEERKKHEEEQKKVSENINKIYAYEYRNV